MPSRTYNYRIRVDTKGIDVAARRARAAFTKQLQNIPIGLQTTGGGGGGRGGGGLGGSGIIPTMDVVNAMQQMAHYTRVVVETAAELSQLGSMYERAYAAQAYFADGAHNVEERLRIVRRETGDSVDNMQALAIANRVAALGLVDTNEQFERMIRFATLSSRVMGRDMAKQLEDLAMAGTNLSFVRLDQLGISATQVRERIEELRNEFPSMTREQAFFEAALQIGEANLTKMGAAALETSTSFERFTTAVANAKLELGRALAGPDSGLLQGNWLSNVMDTFSIRAGGAGIVGRDPKEVIEVLRALEELNQVNVGPAASVSPLMGEGIDELEKFARAMELAKERGVELGPFWDTLFQGMASSVANMGGLTEEQVAKIEEMISVLINLVPITSEYGFATDEAGEAVERTGEAMEAAISSAKGFGDGMQYVLQIARMLTPELGLLEDEAKRVAGALQLVTQMNAGISKVGQGLARGAIGLVPRLAEAQGGDYGTTQAQVEFALGQIEEGINALKAQGVRDPVQLAIAQAQMEEEFLGPLQGIVDDYDEANREGKKAATEWQRTAKQMREDFNKFVEGTVEEFEDAMRGIEGLFGTSDVSKEDMEAAELGIYQEKADEWLRQLRDEVINKVDRPGVDIGQAVDALNKIGVSAEGLKPEAIVHLISRAWADSSLFADKSNLSLLNFGAISGQLNREQMGREGQMNLMEALGMDTSEMANKNMIFDNLLKGLPPAMGLDTGLFAPDQAASIQMAESFIQPVFQEAQNLMPEKTPALISNLASTMQTQAATTENIQAFNQIGNIVAVQIFAGFIVSLGEMGWIGAIGNAIKDDIEEKLLEDLNDAVGEEGE